MATQQMCMYCFDVLLSKLDPNHIPKLTPPKEWLNQKYPLFVTWKKSGRLRGCIGTFEADNLKKNLRNYSLQSALNDSRFSPIKLNEVPLLTCEVNLLIDFEQVGSLYDWKIGTHGIIIKYGGYQATYLPSVAVEQGWSKKQTLESLARKSGYSGPIDNFKLTRYKSSKASLTYEQYKTTSMEVHTQVDLLKWKLPFESCFESNSKVLMISRVGDFYVGTHTINNQKYNSITLDLNKGKVIILASPKELHYFDVDVMKILKEQILVSDIQIMIPKFAWSFSGKVMYFSTLGITTYEIEEPLSAKPKSKIKKYDLSKEFFCLILDEEDNVLYSGIVFEFFNPWKSEKQRRAIYAKMNRARGKKKKYYQRMIKRWDRHSKHRR